MSGLLPVRPISDIKEGETRWHAQVIVLDKSVVRTGKDGHGRRQKCLLQDSQGNMVELMLWDDNIEKFNDTLEPYKSYSVQGARVKKIKEQYQRWSPRMTLEWSIALGTTVEPISDPTQMLPYPPIEPTDLSVVQRFNSETNPFDVLAAVVDIQDQREVPTSDGHKLLQDLLLVDQSLSLTPFTIWGEFIPHQGTDLLELKHTMPIIMCRNLTISRYTGFPSTNLSTYIAIEPNIPEAVALRTWVTENVSTIRSLQARMKAHDEMPINTTNITQTTQESSGSATNDQRVNVIGQLQIPDVFQPIACCICEECNKILCAEMNKEVRCRNCNEIHKALPSYKLSVHIKTIDGMMEATMFAKATEKLLQRTPEHIHTMPRQDLRNLLERINEKFATKTIQAILKPSAKKYENQKEMFSVQQWEITEELLQHESETLHDSETISLATQDKLTTDVSVNKPTGTGTPSKTPANTTPEKHDTKRNRSAENFSRTIPTTISEQQEKARIDTHMLKKVKLEKGAEK